VALLTSENRETSAEPPNTRAERKLAAHIGTREWAGEIYAAKIGAGNWGLKTRSGQRSLLMNMKTESGTWIARTETQPRKHGLDGGIEKTRQIEEETRAEQKWIKHDHENHKIFSTNMNKLWIQPRWSPSSLLHLIIEMEI
jgi:hypothetical protein